MTTFASDHLDRYLRAIGLLLPCGERDDILRELRANLEAELEDRTAGRGAPLSDDEMVAFLRTHGEPAAVAARFQPQRYLIGPAMWPYFWLGAKLLLIAVAVAAAFQTLVAVAGQPQGWPWALLPLRWPLAFVKLAFPVVGVWVLLMALAERGWASRKGAEDWDPRRMDKEGVAIHLEGWGRNLRRGGADLAGKWGDWRWPDGRLAATPGTGTAPGGSCCAMKDTRPQKGAPTFAKAFGEFFGAVVMLVAWIIVFHFGLVLTGGMPTNLSGAPVWAANYSFVCALLVAQLCVSAVPLLQPRSRFLFQASKFLCSVIGIAILVPFLHASSLVVIGPAGDGIKDLTVIGEQINRWAYPGLLLVVLCNAIAAVVHLGKALMALFMPKAGSMAREE